MAMRTFTLIALLAFTAQAHAEEPDSNADNLMDKLADRLVGKLVDKLVDLGSPFANNLGLQASPTSYDAPSVPDEEVIVVEEPQDSDTLAYALGLRGGAAMKAMKSPMKSPMKGMKKMNEYFTKMSEARKTGAKSFVYNGKT